MSDYRPNNINKIYKNIKNLRLLHTETIKLQHGIKIEIAEKPVWAEYNPTHFLYVFFCFNTFYSIDWGKSLNDGRITNFVNKTEGEKYESLLSFCFKNECFCEDFKDKFIDIITTQLTKEQIFDIIKTIKKDTAFLGKIKRNEDIENFKNAVHSLFNNASLNIEDVKYIISFIYKIRNNIFHGTKTLQDMLLIEHQTKLLFYSYFILAVNQMLFSYLDFMYDECNVMVETNAYEDNFNELKKILKVRKENTEIVYKNNNGFSEDDFIEE